MAKDNYKENRQRLADQLKTTPVNTPIQEVRPVELPPISKPLSAPAVVKEEAHVNFWVPSDLMKRLKVHAALTGKTIKEIGIEALENFLPKS